MAETNRDTGAPIAPFVTLTAAEYNQLLAALMAARGLIASGRKASDSWDIVNGYTGKPMPELAAAQKMLAEKLHA
jgi:hypothetical protein